MRVYVVCNTHTHTHRHTLAHSMIKRRRTGRTDKACERWRGGRSDRVRRSVGDAGATKKRDDNNPLTGSNVFPSGKLLFYFA